MIDLRFEHLSIFGYGDARRDVELSDGINVILGPYGSGKTSLLELIRYALGGSARLSEAVEAGVSSVVLRARLSGSAMSFEREMGSHRVRVSQGGEQLAELHATRGNAKGTELASSFLLRSLDLPVMRVRRSRSAQSKAMESISFWDIYRYVHVSQSDMGQSIAGHADSNLNRKRRRAFELMFGLLDETISALEAAESRLQQTVESEQRRLADVTAFLESTGLPSRAQVLESLEAAAGRKASAVSRLEQLRVDLRSQHSADDSDREVLGSLLERRTQLEAAFKAVQSELRERERMLAKISLDIDGLRRAGSAAELLGPLDFSTCPRCLQAVAAERGDAGACYLCLQPVESEGLKVDQAMIEDEQTRLRLLQAEIVELQIDDAEAANRLRRQLEDVSAQVRERERAMRARSDAYVAPLFEDITSLAADVTRAEGEEQRLRGSLSQWDARSTIKQAVDKAESQLAETADALAQERARVERQRELVAEFSETFDEIVRDLELAWYDGSRIDLKTFMPIVNASDYDSLSGGQRTVVSVAYHLALLTVGLVHRSELSLPSLLILDTPSKYLGAKDAAQVTRDYRRISALVDAHPGRLQVIVADNDPPPAGVRASSVIELSYEEPLVPGMEHPGPDQVEPIHDPYDDEG